MRGGRERMAVKESCKGELEKDRGKEPLNLKTKRDWINEFAVDGG